MKKEICNFFIIVFGFCALYFLCTFELLGMFSSIIWMLIIYYIKYRIEKNEKIIPSLPLNHYQLSSEYMRKRIMTDCEFVFFNKIKELESNYIIIPQVNLASIIHKKNAKYCTELFRNIDFGIFTKDYRLLLLIELNDKTHEQIKRKDRDLKVKRMLNECNIPILTFYTCYPNEKEYVLRRIKTKLMELETEIIK